MNLLIKTVLKEVGNIVRLRLFLFPLKFLICSKMYSIGFCVDVNKKENATYCFSVNKI